MADGVSTRLQRDMAHQQQELERIEIKLDGGLAKLQTEIEKMGSEMRSMFEQLMNKDLGKTTGTPTPTSKDGTSSSGPKDFPSAMLVESVDTNSGCFPRVHRTFRLECPRFDGGDFSGWLMKLEQFFEAEKIEEAAKIRVVMMQLEGRALQWHQYYAKANGGLAAHSSAIKGIWTDGTWVFSTGLDQRIRCWLVGEHGELTEHAHLIISVPEPEALDARACGRNHYQIAVAGRGMQMVEFFLPLQ